ncbi:multicopper oxidase [Sorangium cellulosum So ce56]|uniref:Multicopper oxidase n=1 Tax=Sorangium cellulosum (strain So ce56) TaxID=448385 RepID=A9GUS3_SORC5|nr:copper oxidase [Sorangium cellulosum]CAN90660.1 multicopper oxidase [Sorangium cellulosum So ce56]
MDRRAFIHAGGLAAGAAILTQGLAHAQQRPGAPPAGGAAAPPPRRTAAPGGQPAVVTPNGSTLPLRVVDGVKVGHLVAGPLEHEIAPGLKSEVWGYNGSTPGPTIEAVEGDRLRIYVTNSLPEATTVHWHGLVLPNGMDGVAGLTQRPIEPGETYVYEFVVRYPGTYMYHSHFDEMTQIALGAVGMFVVHPRRPRGPRVDRDFVLMTHEWKINAGARRPDPNAMSDFNVLTFNGKAFPATAPLVVGRGERVRVRLGNLGPMDHHPIHLHGLSFQVTATDGGFVPESAQYPETTVLVPVGSTRVIEFVPEEPGDWAMHCHMTHHTMMQMGHGLPNMVGAETRALDRRMRRVMPGYMTMGTTGMGGMGEMPMPIPANSLPMRGGAGPFSYIDMGGMFTVLKVRDDPDKADPAGWYVHPAGTVAGPASAERMRADGIDPASGGKPGG